MMILSLAAKHKSWEHEKEYRIICHRDDFPAIPSKIYIGLNCKEEYRKLLTEVGKSIEVCKVYEMEIDDISSRFGFKQKLITYHYSIIKHYCKGFYENLIMINLLFI